MLRRVKKNHFQFELVTHLLHRNDYIIPRHRTIKHSIVAIIPSIYFLMKLPKKLDVFFGVDLEILLPVKLFFVKVFDQQGKSYVASLRNRTVDVNITTFGGIGNAHFLNQAVTFF